MTAPAVAAEASSTQDTNTTTHTVSMPSGSGGRLVAVVAFDGRPSVTGGTMFDNWVQLVNTAHSGDLSAVRVYYIDDPGTLGGSQTLTTAVAECSAHHVWRVTGAASAAPEAAIFQGNVDTSLDPPSLNPTAWDVEDTLWLALSSSDDGSSTVTGFPSSYSGTGQVNADSSADGVTLGYAVRANATASEDPGAFTISSAEAFCTVTVGIRPAPLVGHVATGTKAGTGTSTQALAYPAGVSAGRLAIACRNAWQNAVTTASESGWLNHTDLLGGLVGTNTTDSHQGRVAVDTRELDGSESGSVTFDQGGTANGVIGLIMLYEKLAGATWDVAVVTGDDATHAANRSAAASGSVSLQPGDVVVVVAAVDTDTSLATFSGPAITASGITFGTTTRRTSGAGVGTGNDGNIEVFDATVTAGTGTTAPTLAFTTGTSQCGPVAFLRLRAQTSINLLVDDAAHAQSTDGVALTQVHAVAVADATQAQATDGVAVAQTHQLAVADSTHAHTADEVTVVPVIDLAPADAGHGHAVDEVAVTQAHEIAVGDAAHGQASDSPALAQAHALGVADAAHAQIADEAALTQAHGVVVADSSHTSAAGSPALTQAHSLSADDAGHSQAADQVALTQLHELAPADATQAHVADVVSLAQDHQLSVDDASHDATADLVTVGQAHELAVAGAHHDHAADEVAVEELGPSDLGVAGSSHGHVAEGVTLTQQHALAVADSTHGHAADQVYITQVHTLAIQDAGHGHSADNPAATQVHGLAVSAALHAQTADALAPAQVHHLTPADTAHAHSADGVTITLDATALVVSDALHGHLPEQVALSQAHDLAVDSTGHAHAAETPTVVVGLVPHHEPLTLTAVAEPLGLTAAGGQATLTAIDDDYPLDGAADARSLVAVAGPLTLDAQE